MSAVAENILTGLPAGRAAVFLGEAGARLIDCIGCAICARMCPDAAIEVYK